MKAKMQWWHSLTANAKPHLSSTKPRQAEHLPSTAQHSTCQHTLSHDASIITPMHWQVFSYVKQQWARISQKMQNFTRICAPNSIRLDKTRYALMLAIKDGTPFMQSRYQTPCQSTQHNHTQHTKTNHKHNQHTDMYTTMPSTTNTRATQTMQNSPEICHAKPIRLDNHRHCFVLTCKPAQKR